MLFVDASPERGCSDSLCLCCKQASWRAGPSGRAPCLNSRDGDQVLTPHGGLAVLRPCSSACDVIGAAGVELRLGSCRSTRGRLHASDCLPRPSIYAAAGLVLNPLGDVQELPAALFLPVLRPLRQRIAVGSHPAAQESEQHPDAGG